MGSWRGPDVATRTEVPGFRKMMQGTTLLPFRWVTVHGPSELRAVGQDCTPRTEKFPVGMVHTPGEGSHWGAADTLAGDQKVLGTIPVKVQSTLPAAMARPIVDSRDCSSAFRTWPCY